MRSSLLFWALCACVGWAACLLGNALTRSDATVGVLVPAAVADPPVGLFGVGETTTASFYASGLSPIEAVVARAPSIGSLVFAAATLLALLRLGQRLGWVSRWWLDQRARLVMLVWILAAAVSLPLLSWLGSATALTAVGSPHGVTPRADVAMTYPLLVLALGTWAVGGRLSRRWVADVEQAAGPAQPTSAHA